MPNAVRNLVDNAARHASARVLLSLSVVDDDALLAVDDDGPGVPAAERERVFERFVRLDEARTRDAGGSGLGLSIVREIVHVHGGTIRISDSPLGGARFEVRLPALIDPVPEKPFSRLQAGFSKRHADWRKHQGPERTVPGTGNAGCTGRSRKGTVTDAETSDDSGSAYEVEIALDEGGEIDVELNDSFEVVNVGEPETEDDDESTEQSVSDSDQAKAKEAALNKTGGGTVDGIERSDDSNAAYEVEVALDNGKEAEVHLDEGFQPVKCDNGQDH